MVEKMTIIHNREFYVRAIRLAILDAFDKVMVESFPEVKFSPFPTRDSDLPKLFPAIDAQIERVLERSNIILVND